MRLLSSGLAALILLAPGPLASQTAADSVVTARVLSRTVLRHPRLTESSGVAVSRSRPGVFWTLNDSDSPAELFATDSAGTDLGVYTDPGLRNQDWEALSLARCGVRWCLYIGDTGDNREVRPEVTVYRWAEPGAAGPRTAPDRIRIRYDRPRDAEAMFALDDGTLFIVAKGRTGDATLYRVPASAWTDPDQVAAAELIQTLPIPVRSGVPWMVTDAALAPNGADVVVRTYRSLHFFRLEPDGRLTTDPTRPVCDITGLEPQGEAIDWVDDDRLVLTSEAVGVMGRSVIIVSCPRR